MPCYHPLTAYQSPEGGKPFFDESKRQPSDFKLKLKCGQCIGCRLDRSRDWAIRCLHENTLHDYSCFITLTYDEFSLPSDGSLNKEHFQKFMKRYRKKIEPRKIRFFHCGEYGDQLMRPHYHACIFGHDFDDKILYKESNGVNLYISEQLAQLWPYGFSTIGDVTFESAAYVARYITKKITGKGQDKIDDKTGLKHYEKIDPYTGEIYELQPEYITMSRRPGIAAEWFRKWKHDVYPDDTVIYRGKEIPPPRYYDKLYQLEDEEALLRIKELRKENMRKHWKDLTPERLKVREEVKLAQFKQLKRGLEE